MKCAHNVKSKIHIILIVHLLILLQTSFTSFYVEGAGCNVLEERVKDYCANPIQPDNLDVKWFQEHADGWYLQFGNIVAKRIFSKLTGGIENPSADMPLCLRSRLDIDLAHDNFAGYFNDYENKNKLAFLNCTGTDCVLTSSDKLYEERTKGYVSYFDGKENHNVLGIVNCLENGDVAWWLVTVSETVSEEENKTALAHFKSIGFNPDLRVPFRTSSCV